MLHNAVGMAGQECTDYPHLGLISPRASGGNGSVPRPHLRRVAGKSSPEGAIAVDFSSNCPWDRS